MEFDLNKCYEILDVEPGASLAQIKAAYKHLAIVWHPDRMPPDNLELKEKATNKLKELNYAYARLKSVEKKDNYTSNKSSQRDSSSSSSNTQSHNSPESSAREDKAIDSFSVKFKDSYIRQLTRTKIFNSILNPVGTTFFVYIVLMTVIQTLFLFLCLILEPEEFKFAFLDTIKSLVQLDFYTSQLMVFIVIMLFVWWFSVNSALEKNQKMLSLISQNNIATPIPL